uniref:CD302 molecule n=1 Tax=Rattus norvegicus TaxID=10116 RepID=A0A8I5ZVX3_RAT
MPHAALSSLVLLSLATAIFADCPSSIWVQFQGSCYTFLQVTINVENIEDVRKQCTDHGADLVSIHNEEENAFILDTLQKRWKGPDDLLLGMFYDTDDASFKWFDQSNMTFDKWADEDGEDLVDTCGFLYAKTGEWRKGNCEMSSVTGTLCKTAIPYDKKYLSAELQPEGIISTVIVTLSVRLLPSAGGTANRNKEPGRIPAIPVFLPPCGKSGVDPLAEALPDAPDACGLLAAAPRESPCASR